MAEKCDVGQSVTWEPRSESIKQLLENESTIFNESCSVLIKIIKSIFENPNDSTCRRVYLNDIEVIEKLLPAHGALTCLFEMGFEESDDCLYLPTSKSIIPLNEIYTEIVMAQLHRKKSVIQVLSTNQAASSYGDRNGPLRNSSIRENQLLARLWSYRDHVLTYEKDRIKQKALKCIPLVELKSRATKLIAEAEEHDLISESDSLLVALLDWFKNSFFSWVDVPLCEICGNNTCKLTGFVEPLPCEIQWGGARVEDYLCSTCNRHTRFPRYNDPEMLMDSRRGRCGEWANCFTALCVALGYESRYVIDWTDHVWTEVYSTALDRWIHADPCENVRDKPLLYEKGWGKKLTYVFAISKDDIQDVTWRYSSNHRDTLRLRTECRETWLVHAIVDMQQKLQRHCSPSRKELLMNRRIKELIEILTEQNSDEVLGGRTTGSITWRRARGELGKGDSGSSKNFMFTLSDDEVEAKRFDLSYCCSRDIYVHHSNSRKEIKCWHNLVYEHDSIQRKVEKDWKMVYLARTENTSSASISWMIDSSDSGLVIDTIDICARCECFQSGKVRWQLCGDDSICCFLEGDGSRLYERVDDLRGCRVLKLSAHLSGGDGDNAWQHTQLFRQPMDADDCPLRIIVHYRHP